MMKFEGDPLKFRQASTSLPCSDTGVDGCQRNVTAETLEERNTRIQEPLGYLHTKDIVGPSPAVQWLRAVAMGQSEGTHRRFCSRSQQRCSPLPNNEDVSLYDFWVTIATYKMDYESTRMSFPPWQLQRDSWTATCLSCRTPSLYCP